MFSPDGRVAVRLSGTGTLTDAAEVGRRLAAELLAEGADTRTGRACMTRTRKTVGRISFVGAGPGDPGLLTRRAHDALRGADHMVYDRGVPEALLEWSARGRGGRDPTADRAEATSSARPRACPATWPRCCCPRPGPGCARCTWSPATRSSTTSVVKEVQAVARTAVPFEVVPGRRPAGRGGHLRRRGADRAYGPPWTSTTSHALDFEALAAAAAARARRSTVDAGDLAAVRDGLLAAGVDGTTPIAVTGDGTGDTQYTTASTVDSFVAAALGFTGRVVLSLGPGLAHREKLGWWENRPLYGWKVLVPRTKEQAGAMSERLRAYGAMPCEVPTIAVEPPRTPAQMERAIKGLVDGRYAWTIFTSVNAVRAVWEKFAEHGLDARHFGGVKIACIGEATADAVRAFGIQPELIPAGEQTSEGLLAEFSPHDEILDPVGRVLLPRADIATETLAAGLTERGWEVDDVTAYRTVRAAPPPAEIRDAIKSGGFDAVLFTSSSTVRNLVGIAGKPHTRTVVAVIGPKTADTAAEFGLRVDVQPPHAVGARSGRGARRRTRSSCARSSPPCRPSSAAAPRCRARPRCGSDDRCRAWGGNGVVSRSSGRAGCATHARPCAGWSPRPGVAPGRAGPAHVRQGRADRAAADRVAARRRPALPGVAAQGGGRGGPGRRRRHHALRRARRSATRPAPAVPTRTASSTSRSATSSPRSATPPSS